MQPRNKRGARGFSLIELLIVVAIILVIAAIAIPSLIKSRQTSNESAAAASLKTMNTALFRYSQQCPGTGYPASLVNLGPGPGDCTASQDLDGTLGVAAPAKSGFNFTYAPGAANAAGIVDTFTINADPWSATAARKHFFIAQDGVIHWNGTAPAAATDPAI